MPELGDAEEIKYRVSVDGVQSAAADMQRWEKEVILLGESFKKMAVEASVSLKTVFAIQKQINDAIIRQGSGKNATGAEAAAADEAMRMNSQMPQTLALLTKTEASIRGLIEARTQDALATSKQITAEQRQISLLNTEAGASAKVANRIPQITDTDSQKTWNDFLKQGQRTQEELTQISLANTKQRSMLIQEEGKAKEVEIKQAIAYEKEYMAARQSSDKTMSLGAQEAGARINTVATTIKTLSESSGLSMQQVGQNFVDAGMPINTVNSALQTLTPNVKKSSSAFAELGNVLSTTFGFGLYSIIQQIFQGIIEYLKQVATAGYEFSKSMYLLQVGINAMRRTGVDIITEDVMGNIQAMKEKFGMFSTADLVKGSASLVNLIRDFGFTKEEIFKLQDAIATLAVVNGRSMDEVQKTVALTLSSGYTEGLQRLGVSINRVTIALEAQRLGWGRNYLALTESQRAMASYNIVLAKTAKYQKDLESYQMSFPGMVDKSKSAWKDFTMEMGEGLQKYYGGIIVFFSSLLNILLRLQEAWNNKGPANYFNQVVAGLAGIKAVLGSRENLLGIFSAGTGANAAFVNAQKSYLGSVNLADIEKQAEEENKLVETIDSTIKEIENLTEEEVQSREDLLTDLQRSLEDIERDGAAKRAEIERDYIQTIKDLNINLQRDLAEANRQYQYDLQKLAADTANRRAEIEREYAQKILENQQDLQKKLHRLREEYIFDLDEAIRGGDVRQVRKLMRQYTFDKHKIVEDQKDVTQEAKQEYEQQLADLQRSDAQKRQELLISYQQKIADIRLNFQQQMTEAAIQHQQELEDLKRSMQEQREERQRQYAQQLADLQLSINRKLQTIAKGLSAEIAYTDAAMKRIYESAYAVLGPNGNMDKLLQYYKAMWGGSGVVPGTGTGGTSISAPDPTKFASGGTLLATKPTLAMFGERPEVVTFQPLGSNTMGSSSSDGGRVVMKISLSPGLEASIVENALDEFSKVLLSVERSR
jgi:hypothetical protein